ncbi:MAG TPA: hypothetical protein VGG94_01770 [Chthoniobacterales bacterium]
MSKGNACVTLVCLADNLLTRKNEGAEATQGHFRAVLIFFSLPTRSFLMVTTPAMMPVVMTGRIITAVPVGPTTVIGLRRATAGPGVSTGIRIGAVQSKVHEKIEKTGLTGGTGYEHDGNDEKGRCPTKNCMVAFHAGKVAEASTIRQPSKGNSVVTLA